jgi:hypothetical protein
MNKENVTFTKVKLLNSGGVEAFFSHSTKREDGQVIQESHAIKRRLKEDPDLTNAFQAFKQYLGKCVGISYLAGLKDIPGLTDAAKKHIKALEKTIKEHESNQLNKIEVTGITIAGDEDSTAIVISGKMLQANNSKVAINSPRIPLENNTFGFESKLESLIETLRDETYLYLFEGKAAQLELFGGEDDEETSGKDLAAGEKPDDEEA